MREIAIYGKGGIGKSTVSANLSAALASLGRRILQIGCDPKHDSTRLLTHGKKQTTALDYMRVTTPPDYQLADILLVGFGGVGCIEAGGPQPGVGCAGRGIISTFELLNQWKLKDNYDHILYDVLGDVVCGGFAVPIRREYADTIFIVTSGEYMSLYAANNILRGVQNYDTGDHRVAGIIYNKRNIEDEDGRIRRFAEAVGLPICAEIPRSETFAKAERLSMTVVEYSEDAAVRGIFTDLAKRMLDGLLLHEAKPLADDELERIVLGQQHQAVLEPESTVDPLSAVKANMVAPADENRYLSKNVVRGEPLHGCAFNGAMTVCAHIRNAVILAHAPKSCAYITLQTVTSTGRRMLFERGALLPVSLAPHIECTEMGETEMVFGGMEKLREKIAAIQLRSSCAVIVVSACPAGIIGDDIDQLRTLSRPDMPVVTVKADGNMTGDFLQGLMTSCVSLARQIIKRDAAVIKGTVNIVAEKIITTNTEKNFSVIKSFLDGMGLSVNCRFVYDTDFDSLRNFCSAQLNLPAFRDYGGQMFENFLTSEYGCEFFHMAFPVGFYETCKWLRGVSRYFGAEAAAEEIIAENTKTYECELQMLKPVLAGKRLMVITYNHELDWILEPAVQLGVEIVKLGILNFSQDEGFRTRQTVPLPVEEGYDREKRTEDIARYRPDILLTNYQSSVADDVPLTDTIPMCPDVGFFSGLHMAQRWARLLDLGEKGEWQQDAELLNKYYA